MFHTLGRSVTVGLFAAAASLGAILGASGIASANPVPEDGHDERQAASHDYIPVPKDPFETGPGSGPHSELPAVLPAVDPGSHGKLPAVDPGLASPVGKLPAVILHPNAIGSIITPTM